MTAPQKSVPETRSEPRPSLLPFDPADLMAMRVRPATFAGMCNVSKQTVSRWIKEGKVTLGPDGLLDPNVASRQVIERTDPARLRARVFKQASSGLDALRQRILSLEGELLAERQAQSTAESAGRFRAQDEAEERLCSLIAAIVARFNEAIDAHRRGDLDQWFDEMVAVEFYGQDPQEYRRQFAEDAEIFHDAAPTSLRETTSQAERDAAHED